jgi:hypothetical protein
VSGINCIRYDQICRLWNGFHFLWCSIHYCSVFFFTLCSVITTLLSVVLYLCSNDTSLCFRGNENRSRVCIYIVWGSIAQPTSCVMWKVVLLSKCSVFLLIRYWNEKANYYCQLFSRLMHFNKFINYSLSLTILLYINEKYVKLSWWNFVCFSSL